MENNSNTSNKDCSRTILAIHDVMDILGGRWKISILACLIYRKMRFSELQREVKGISGKMLSQELKELEINQLISRNIADTHPVTVEYELTEYGHTLRNVIEILANWGIEHRKRLFEK